MRSQPEGVLFRSAVREALDAKASASLGRLELTADQGAWKTKARKIAESVLASGAAEVDCLGRFPKESLRALGAAGFFGLTCTKELGGAGADILTAALVIEELAQGCASTAMCFHMHLSTVPSLRHWRTRSRQSVSSSPYWKADIWERSA